MEINKWNVIPHRFPQSHVVSMTRIGTAILVLQQAIQTEAIIVRAVGRSYDRKRGIMEYRGSENALGRKQRNPLSFDDEPVLEEIPWQNFTVKSSLLRKPIKGGCSNFVVC
ncbi:MAG TPA: hypothetical protein VLY03_03760 [Bacteroidota bacterium]|nr:hypothetical protein [Bacteroidota bacterium]